MVSLYFDPSKIPRTIQRKEWYEIHRWRRVTEKRLREAVQEQINNLAAFGTTMPQHVKTDIIDKIVNPPILLGPYMDGK